jgi:predicted solute-binding protein
MSNKLEKLSIGAVSYLNSKPLIHGLPQNTRLLEPSALATEYERGAFDIALIPIVACLQNPGCRLLDIGIGANGEVHSVILTLPKPLTTIKKVSLDPSSRTSVNLIRVLLERHYNLTPEYTPHGEPADAQVLIGTKAIDFRAANPQTPVLDMAMAWKEYTGLPFIFAAWAIHPQSPMTEKDITLFRAATLAGMKHRREIAKNDFELHYLTHLIRYRFDANYQAAVPRLAEEMQTLGLLQPSAPPPFI